MGMELFRVCREPAHFSISAFQHFSFSDSLPSPAPRFAPRVFSPVVPWSRSLVVVRVSAFQHFSISVFLLPSPIFHSALCILHSGPLSPLTTALLPKGFRGKE